MIKFHTDHYFHIGSAHYTSGKPCQDYSFSGSDENTACATVSDGCSTGRHTDIGARILALSTFQATRDYTRSFKGSLDTVASMISSSQQQIIGMTRRVLDLGLEDMLATSGYIYLTQRGGIVNIQGDGVVALKYRSGGIEMSRFEWENNIPFYPAYMGEGLDRFVAAHDGNMDAPKLSRERIQLWNTGLEVRASHDSFSLREGINGISMPISMAQLSQLEFVAVFTDGVTQIDGVSWQKAVVNFLAFKTTGGEFAKRRMIRGIQDYQKIGKGPVDDIAISVIRIENTDIEGVISEG